MTKRTLPVLVAALGMLLPGCETRWQRHRPLGTYWKLEHRDHRLGKRSPHKSAR